MTSGGGLTTLETAIRFPIRLVESGPAGGAILAAHIARQKGIDAVLSFDMGGTTAKICLIDGGEPQAAREFEVDRRTRFLKGSGLPVRMPVIEMVEIGAGGGSIAHARSAAPDRGRAGKRRRRSGPRLLRPGRHRADGDRCRPGARPHRSGRVRRRPHPAAAGPRPGGAATRVGAALGLDAMTAAFGISEMVEEAMANAARVHAVERGKDLAGRTLIAFGGGAPLHAARLAEKLGIGTVLIPRGAGVGSAIGFLRAPVGFRGRAQPVHARVWLRCGTGQRPVRRNGSGGGGRGAAWRTGRRRDAGAHGRDALRRPGPRDRRAAAGAPLHTATTRRCFATRSRPPIRRCSAAPFPSSIWKS